ncbi:hypothetical protein DESC_810084 [Desulfosarcina cetonica]|uniref:hypothetical protein n=1 Tax=Desulfosarcina cetonica TaxID=90730 RepID=UPI0006D1FC62|nr:hypothetical protein [Desulfosarcina cetonica]VTR70513.1 hypothetical protein DESC_810084 [Desulfosarcina cetonica]
MKKRNLVDCSYMMAWIALVIEELPNFSRKELSDVEAKGWSMILEDIADRITACKSSKEEGGVA